VEESRLRPLARKVEEVSEEHKHKNIFVSSSPRVLRWSGHACNLAACLMRVNARLCGMHTDKPVT
jgi:hypothetical protein